MFKISEIENNTPENAELEAIKLEREKKEKIEQNKRMYLAIEHRMITDLDEFTEENFNFIFEPLYADQIYEKFFDYELDESFKSPDREKIKSEFENLKIMDAIKNVKAKSEEIATREGINRSPKKSLARIRNIPMIVMFGGMILAWIPFFAQASYIIMFGMMFLGCYLQYALPKKFMASWNAFRYKNQKELRQAMGDEIIRMKKFNQLIINDCFDFITENSIPRDVMNLILYSKDYENLQMAREINRNEQIMYRMIFSGSDIPGADITDADLSVIEEEVIDKDIFISFPDIKYSDTGSIIIDNVQYLTPNLQKKIENILNMSEFTKVTKQEDIIQNLSSNNEILCGCNSSIEMEDLQLIKSKNYPKFEFYMVICAKCDNCENNPFIIFTQKDTVIPEELSDIF
ncbi:MAG: hypothetical protein GY870_10560 [archaeon]|nr:hypothetical protein [archaeon]